MASGGKIKRTDINFPVIKIKLNLLNKTAINIEKSKNVKNLLYVLSTGTNDDKNVSYKYDNGVFNVIVTNVLITRNLVNGLLKILFDVLKRVKNVVGFQYFIIMSKTKTHSFKYMNKKIIVKRENIEKFMSFINE